MAGGCLVTDNQSKTTLNYEILSPGIDYLSFDSIDQSIDIINELVRNHELRSKLCKSGYEKLHSSVMNNSLSKLIVAFMNKCNSDQRRHKLIRMI